MLAGALPRPAKNGERVTPMIDDPDITERLLARLEDNLPLRANLTGAAHRLLRHRSPERRLPRQCEIAEVQYAGDEGGIVCRIDFGLADTKELHFLSITHLSFDRNSPLSREIAAYQKHRIKKLRRLHDFAA
jgi:hypothetical protein